VSVGQSSKLQSQSALESTNPARNKKRPVKGHHSLKGHLETSGVSKVKGRINSLQKWDKGSLEVGRCPVQVLVKLSSHTEKDLVMQSDMKNKFFTIGGSRSWYSIKDIQT